MKVTGRIPRELLDALTRTPEVKRRLEAVADQIRDDAVQHAPRLTGNLARNIIVVEDVDEDGQPGYAVGWSSEAPYGPLVEFGTEDTPARPHLRPAADKVRRQVER